MIPKALIFLAGVGFGAFVVVVSLIWQEWTSDKRDYAAKWREP